MKISWTPRPCRSVSTLKPCFAADPSDVEVLSLLAQAFLAIGQVTKAGASWREIAHAHQRAGRAAELKAAWERVRELLPGDAELPMPELPGPPLKLAELYVGTDLA